VLILSNEDVASLLTMDEAIEALRISNREVAEFRNEKEHRLNRARTNHYLPWHDDSPQGRDILAAGGGNNPRVVYNFKSMEGGSPHFGVWAVRSSSDLVRLASSPYGLTHTFLRYGDLPDGKGYSDLIFLYNIHDAQFEAIIKAASLQAMRVAATSALGTDYLCRRDVATLGLFGSGWQAAANLRALILVRPTVKRVHVFSPNQENRAQFAAGMSAELGIDVVPVASPEEAVVGMDVIYEASRARTPVFDGTLLRPGQYVMSLGAGDEHFERRLIDPRGIAKCSVVAAHSLEVRYGLEEISDCVENGDLSWSDVKELPDLVTGEIEGGASGEQIAFFKNNVGLGSQFAAVGGLVLAKAKRARVGFEVPQHLVSQVMSRASDQQ
jgi:alanine dehydrogenase